MVKQRKKSNKKRHNGKGFKTNGAKARKIDASTIFETCTEQLSPFGGLLPLIKFFDLVGFKDIFNLAYLRPRRNPKLGHYLMLVGILLIFDWMPYFADFSGSPACRWPVPFGAMWTAWESTRPIHL